MIANDTSFSSPLLYWLHFDSLMTQLINFTSLCHDKAKVHVMVTGVSGVMAVAPGCCALLWHHTKRDAGQCAQQFSQG